MTGTVGRRSFVNSEVDNPIDDVHVLELFYIEPILTENHGSAHIVRIGNGIPGVRSPHIDGCIMISSAVIYVSLYKDTRGIRRRIFTSLSE